MANAEATRARVAQALEGIEHGAALERDGMLCLILGPEDLRAALERLRARAGFESLTLVTAIDRLPASPRFAVVHQLHSLAHNDRVRLVTELPDGRESCPSAVDLWPGGRYMERECFDMFGIVFTGHAGLKRLLMPLDYEHHPLRKDFPHQGIEPDKLYGRWDAERRADARRES